MVRLGPANLSDGELRGFTVGEKNVLVTCVEGRYRAMDDWCNHAGCLLSGGRVEDNTVVCPCHDVGFDLDTGRNVTSPGVCGDQTAFEVVVEEGHIVLTGRELGPGGEVMGHEGHDHGHHPHPHPHHSAEGSHAASEHKAHAPAHVAAFVVTCSDSRSTASDETGVSIRAFLESAGHTVCGSKLVRDEPSAIRGALQEAEAAGARAVIFNGGTGVGRRDSTVDALRPMFEKELPGFGELFRALSYQEIGSAALMSRATAGTVKGMIVFALPGSPQGVKLAMEKLILPELGHLVRELSR